MGIKQRIQSSLQLYKDQLMFVLFQLIMYVADIVTDTIQAEEFWRYVVRKL